MSVGESPSQIPPVPSRATRILVVEDERTVRLGCVLALREQGWEVIGESSPLNALRMAPEGAFDLVVLDYQMPGLDGLGLLRALGAPGRRPQVLLMSAWADGAVTAEALRAGVVDFMEKPLTPAELRARVRAMLERRRRASHRDASGEPVADSAAARREFVLTLAERAAWPEVREFVTSLPVEQQTEFLSVLAGIACEFASDRETAQRWFRAARFPATWRFSGPEIFAELGRRLAGGEQT